MILTAPGHHRVVPTTPMLTAVALVLAVVALLLIGLRRRDEPVAVLSLDLAIVAIVVGALAAAVVGVVAGLDVFGVAHLVYLIAVLTVPAVGLGVLVLAWRRGAARMVWGLALVALLPAAVGFYATHVEPFRLRVDHHDLVLDTARGGGDPFRIGVLSDLQTTGVGDHERAAVDRLMAERPDLVLMPGDLFQDHLSAEDLADMRELLGRLDAPHGIYFVRGDTDGGDGGSADQILDGLDITVLVDEVVDIETEGRAVRIGGTALTYDTAAAQAVKADLEATADDEAVTILLSHRPDTVFGLARDSRVDLTVSGHTHGGQIALPGLGPLVTLSEVPRDVARGGLHEIDGNAIYVSPGVGMERHQAPQVRFLSRPSVAILTLTPAGE